jgi:hypothetical protein
MRDSGVGDSSSASPAIGLLVGVRRQRGGKPPFIGNRGRRSASYLGEFVLPTLSGSSGFPIAATQLDPVSANGNAPKQPLATSPNRP